MFQKQNLILILLVLLVVIYLTQGKREKFTGTPSAGAVSSIVGSASGSAGTPASQIKGGIPTTKNIVYETGKKIKINKLPMTTSITEDGDTYNDFCGQVTSCYFKIDGYSNRPGFNRSSLLSSGYYLDQIKDFGLGTVDGKTFMTKDKDGKKYFLKYKPGNSPSYKLYETKQNDKTILPTDSSEKVLYFDKTQGVIFYNTGNTTTPKKYLLMKTNASNSGGDISNTGSAIISWVNSPQDASTFTFQSI